MSDVPGDFIRSVFLRPFEDDGRCHGIRQGRCLLLSGRELFMLRRSFGNPRPVQMMERPRTSAEE